MDMTMVKHEIEALADAYKEEFEAVSAFIFENPELGCEEKKAQKALCDLLENHGFDVQRGYGSLETAFVAEYKSGKPGMTFAFMCEYDALPEIGHACGHNLIGTSGAGAGVVLKEIMEKHEIGGTLKVMGCPAEESLVGKVTMLDEGAFDGIDMALVMHPSDESMADDIAFAAVNKIYKFKGKPAHTAACPWMGASAGSAVQIMMHAVDAMRVHFKDYSRVHGIVLDGGMAVNIIPERASCKFNMRALDAEYLEKEIIAVVDRCAKGAAMCAGVELEIEQEGNLIKDVRNDRRLVESVAKNMDFIGEHHIPRTLNQGIGSTDVGNVTHALPAAQFYIGLGAGVGTHTAAFATVAGGPEGKRALGAAVKVLAMTGLDMLTAEK
ncbi:MAG: M20 family metallopeptidase [Lachnospiraceae bacterium]|nr:M20 family metallopeptidase [Lachnospiraceae bacterium]